MSSLAADLMSNIENVAATNKSITYTLQVDATARKLVGEAVLVTYTTTNQTCPLYPPPP